MMSKSARNLQLAFTGESEASRKYLAFAKRAEEEGFRKAARLFRAVAAAETINAHNHLKELGGIQSTMDNLRAAVNGEVREFAIKYPQMISDAESEGRGNAVRTFRYANEVEKNHAALCLKALEELGINNDDDYYVCRVCGYTVEGEAPDDCPVCRARKQAFMIAQ